MSFLRTDYSNTNDFSALPVGNYECFVTKTTMKDTSTGKKMISVELTVRDDVEQGGQKRKFFDNLVVQDNMMWKFNQVAKAVDLPEGQDVATPEDFAQAILYRACRIKNKHETYNGEIQDRVKNWEASEVGGEAAGIGDGGFAGGSIEIGDEDLPF